MPSWSRYGTASCALRCRHDTEAGRATVSCPGCQVYFCDSTQLPCAMSSFFVFTSVGFAIQQGAKTRSV
eukprot:762564-Hanusia_phi.AAC.1